MRWLAVLIGVVMAIVGGYNLGTTTSGSRGAAVLFNYGSASPEDRQAWLEKESANVERGVKAGLSRNGSSYMYMSYKATKVSARRSEIQTIVQLKSHAQIQISSNFRKQILGSLCSDYVGSPLYHNKIKLTMKMVRSNGTPVFSQSVGAYDCDRFQGAATS